MQVSNIPAEADERESDSGTVLHDSDPRQPWDLPKLCRPEDIRLINPTVHVYNSYLFHNPNHLEPAIETRRLQTNESWLVRLVGDM